MVGVRSWCGNIPIACAETKLYCEQLRCNAAYYCSALYALPHAPLGSMRAGYSAAGAVEYTRETLG
eukprot:4808907-Heterocapsa_arctica.AAC.1